MIGILIITLLLCGIKSACYAPRQPLQNHPPHPGHYREQTPPWSGEEMLNGQCKRVDITAHARTARNGLPQNKLNEDLR